jgi:hypothetical protein
MKFCRINLSETNYTPLNNFILFVSPPVEKLQTIYREYCQYKKFESVMPIFESQFTDTKNDTYGYVNNVQEIVAFSIVRRHDTQNAESMQFAWNYADPLLQLGIRSLETECAIYKKWGYQYLYLGEAADYKAKLDGYEILGYL